MKILDNKLYIFLEKLANLFLLNFIFIVASLPIVTIFPAIAAMFSVIRQWRLRQETTVLKPFIKHFKLNFKQSFIIGLLWVPFGVLLYINYAFIIQTQSKWNIVLLVPLFLIALIFAFMSTYIFSILVHYQVNIRNLLKNTFIVSLAYFPTTLLLIIIGIVFLIILLFLPITSIIIFSLGAFINFLLCNRTFQKIEAIMKSSS